MDLLYISELPRDIEAAKDDDSSNSIDGGAIAAAALVKAIVEYSTADIIVFPRLRKSLHGDLRDSKTFLSNEKRIRFCNNQELLEIANKADSVLLSTAIGLEPLSYLRGLSVLSAPIVGITHSLAFAGIIPFLSRLYLAPLTGGDALVCTSTAAQTAIRNMFEFLDNRFATIGLKLTCDVQTPVIPLGVVYNRLRAKHAKLSNPVVLYFGRLSTRSKADLLPLLIAWSKRERAIAGIQLVIAGDDTQSRIGPRLKDAADILHCSDSVEIVCNPTKAKKDELFERASIFISPSDNLQETFGLTILEAMMAGLPVVASDWSGYRDLVKEGETGFLVPTILPGVGVTAESRSRHTATLDSVASCTAVDMGYLLDRVDQLLLHPELINMMRRNAHKIATANYTWPKIVHHYENLWAELKQAGRKQSQPRRAGLGFEDWCVEDIFGHYATSLLSPDSAIELNGHRGYVPYGIEGEQIEELWKYLSTLLADGPMSIYEISTELVPRSPSMQELIMWTGRLLKYGYISLSKQCPKIA